MQRDQIQRMLSVSSLACLYFLVNEEADSSCRLHLLHHRRLRIQQLKSVPYELMRD